MDHFLWRKGYPYEAASHIPLLLRWPESRWLGFFSGTGSAVRKHLSVFEGTLFGVSVIGKPSGELKPVFGVTPFWHVLNPWDTPFWKNNLEPLWSSDLVNVQCTRTLQLPMKMVG